MVSREKRIGRADEMGSLEPRNWVEEKGFRTMR